MRSPFCLAAAFLPCIALGQTSSGTYRPVNGAPSAWSINAHHALIWNGEPYLPNGIVSDGDPSHLAAAKAAGVRDVILPLSLGSANWQQLIAQLDAGGWRYLLKFTDKAPLAKGIVVQPHAYRIPNLTAKRHISVPIAGATNALVILVSQRDASVAKQERIAIRDGTLEYDVPAVNGLEHVLLIYPEMASASLPDFWEGLDQRRDDFLSTMRSAGLGAGLRGLVNPLGEVESLSTRNNRLVPTSSFFRDELAGRLEAKYRSVETASRAWIIRASDLDSFEKLARLVPLWSGSRGVPKLWDPATDMLYDSDSRRSSAWNDIEETISLSATRRLSRLSTSIRKVADVPVIQEWAGWSASYEGELPAFDGIAVVTQGPSRSKVVNDCVRAVSSAVRASRPIWLIATNVKLADPISDSAVIRDIGELGFKGWFVETSQPRAFEGMLDPDVATWAPIPVFYPEHAVNPAMPLRLSGALWWLPAPFAGERIDLGSQFAAYRMSNGSESTFVLWSTSGKRKTVLRLVDPAKVSFQSTDGQDIVTKPVKNGIELELSEYPIIIRGTPEIPVPDEAAEETILQFRGAMAAIAPSQDRFAEEQFWFSEAAAGFQRNPGGSMLAMRALLARILTKMAPYTWIEAESAGGHSFSEAITNPSCSMQGALLADSRIPGSDHLARYDVPIRGTGDVEFWIAARIPRGMADAVTITLAGQTYGLSKEPISPYGDGFAWFHVTTTRVAGSSTSATVAVRSGATVALDALVLYPGLFRPRGPFMPVIALPPATPKQP